MIFEHLACDERDVEDLSPADPGHRVQVDAQLVGMVEVVGAHRMRVEVHAAQVHRPDQPGGVVQHRLLGRGARRVLELGNGDEVGPVRRRTLLENRLLPDALDEPLEDHRSIPHAAQRPVGHRRVVLHQVQLGQPDLVEDHLVGVGDGHLRSTDLERLASRHSFIVCSRPRCDRRHIGWAHVEAQRYLRAGRRQGPANGRQVPRAWFGRVALRPQDVLRRGTETGAPARHRSLRRRHPPVGRVRDDPGPQCTTDAQRSRGDRRLRRDDVQGTRRRRQRGGQRPARQGHQGR